MLDTLIVRLFRTEMCLKLSIYVQIRRIAAGMQVLGDDREVTRVTSACTLLPDLPT